MHKSGKKEYPAMPGHPGKKMPMVPAPKPIKKPRKAGK